MKKFVYTILAALFIPASFLCAQPTGLQGLRIFINPGHGGHDDNDRHMITTDFWESDGNLEKGLFLRTLLQNLNAEVFISRTTNYTSDDLALSAIAEMANQSNSDMFLAIHSNGFNGVQNVPLMLFRGYDDQPVYPASKTMAQILWQKVFDRGNCWTRTTEYVKGDWTFYPEWGTSGLGVLRPLTMPGVLSEGSFHDYIPESWRLRNNDFLHHEAWAFTRAFLEYFNRPALSHGVIAGVVRDPLINPEWYYHPGSKDQALPLNGVDVLLTPGNDLYTTDNLNNGFFMFDSLPPGEYKLFFDGLDDYYRDSLTVTVTANRSTLPDFAMQFDTTIVPQFLSLTPVLTDSLPVNQAFTFTFDLPMNRDSVTKALHFTPETQLLYSWNEKSTVLEVKPAQILTGKTDYTITISLAACSEWKVPLANPLEFHFVTKNRSHLKIERVFPAAAATGVTLYPQVRVYTDAPLNQSSATEHIQVKDLNGQALQKVREEFRTVEGRGSYFFELSQALETNKQYQLVLDAVLTDAYGTPLSQEMTVNFTTRTRAYDNGNVIETFDVLGHFWDPEASGSTTGTDNPATTFTASPVVKRSGANAGRLDYVFINNSGGVCRTFNTLKPSAGSDDTKFFGVWIFGDLSFNNIEYWFYSSSSVNQIVSVCTIDWAGWDFKMIPFSSVGGGGERLFHSTVLRQMPSGSKTGTIWFDDAMVLTPTAVNDINSDNLKFELYPNPLAGNGTVRFFLDEESTVVLKVYSSDGRQVAESNLGIQEPGSVALPWSAPEALPDGVYLVRLEIRSLNSILTGASSKRCVLMRGR